MDHNINIEMTERSGPTTRIDSTGSLTGRLAASTLAPTSSAWANSLIDAIERDDYPYDSLHASTSTSPNESRSPSPSHPGAPSRDTSKPIEIRRGGYFGGVAKRPTLTFAANKGISASIQRDPDFLHNAGIALRPDMTFEEVNMELQKGAQYSKVESMRHKEALKHDKQVDDVIARITAYVYLIPAHVIPPYMVPGIVGNLQRYPHENSTQQLARIRVQEGVYKTMARKYENSALNNEAQKNEAIAVLLNAQQ